MRRAPCGFTLVENLAALATLAIGLLGFAALLTSALTTLRATAERQAAVGLADALASRVGTVDSSADFSALPDFDGWRREVAARLPHGIGSITRSAHGAVDVVTIDVRWETLGRGPAHHRIDIAVAR
jgi:Tfp pilus assembly protein PilV